ncbi:MAG: metallophosphoesterase [Candidatus Marinimicrobia bacterium]|nr:metallophosphoesterase [Candidatus Neomarinimicrobiota bacterium]MCF7851560.1 metallophosphoesterase [Candidatus Neomarinimicrobiota bacterium]MCF7904680.1 metallophosphoesterase [Candidatus Neomarinimicrobiota bacterium]
MFIIIALLVLGLLHGYVGFRLIEPFSLNGPYLILYWSLIIILAITPIVAMVLRFKGQENVVTDILLYIAYTTLGLFTLAFVLFLVRDLIWFLSLAFDRLMILFDGKQSLSSKVDPERRKFLLMSLNYGIVGATGVLGTLGFIQAKKLAQVFRHQITISRLPEGLDGLRIVQVSDLHVGPTIKRDYVEKVVKQVNDLKPDLIFFTGDMVDGSVEYLANDVEPLGELKSKYGKFFVTGNHEYYSGVEFWLKKVELLGMTTLMNEHRILEIAGEKIAIAGVTDLMAHQMNRSHASDPVKAVQGISQDIPILLLAHQPGTADAIQDLDIDLMVCGHTHGGQYYPFKYAVSLAHSYVSGLYTQGKTQVYVNQGTGYWGPPLRLGIPSEITLFELLSERSEPV